MPANWTDYGKAAGVLRNARMAKEGQALVAFIGPKSKGTKNMIDTMRDVGKPAVVVPVLGDWDNV